MKVELLSGYRPRPCRQFMQLWFEWFNPFLFSLNYYSLELRNMELEAETVNLHEELEQERKKYTMVEIKLRNAERAKDDAEKRNEMLQKEMEQFFSTFGDLTADPRRPERANTIWIQ